MEFLRCLCVIISLFPSEKDVTIFFSAYWEDDCILWDVSVLLDTGIHHIQWPG